MRGSHAPPLTQRLEKSDEGYSLYAGIVKETRAYLRETRAYLRNPRISS
jgi:hypothetical protein